MMESNEEFNDLKEENKLSPLFNLGRIPNILLYGSFAGLGILYAVSVTVAAPVLFAGGIFLATAFAMNAIAEVWKIFAEVPQNKEEEDKKKLSWLKPNFLEFLSTEAIGLGLLALGILMLVGPAFLGALAGVGFAVKIGLVVAGITFLAKGVFSYASAKLNPKTKAILENAPNVLLYGAGLGLGIAALVLNGAFAVAPFLFAAIFLMRTIASFARMFDHSKFYPLFPMKESKIAKGFEIASLFVLGGALVVAGSMFAPAVAAFLGISALFSQIAGCVAGGLFVLAAFAKIFVGQKIERKDFALSTGMSLNQSQKFIGPNLVNSSFVPISSGLGGNQVYLNNNK
ncbi:MAG: hypothetical protein IJU86_00240 [Firmicutes bacterium]|nr:hypothetical protein [Bacillota bacterium]